jgi:hypothetical protein
MIFFRKSFKMFYSEKWYAKQAHPVGLSRKL